MSEELSMHFTIKNSLLGEGESGSLNFIFFELRLYCLMAKTLIIFFVIAAQNTVYANLNCRGSQGKSYEISLDENSVIEKMGSLQLRADKELKKMQAKPMSSLIKDIFTLLNSEGKTVAVLSFFNDGSIRGSVSKDRVSCF
jgi:hypothetical protein